MSTRTPEKTLTRTGSHRKDRRLDGDLRGEAPNGGPAPQADPADRVGGVRVRPALLQVGPYGILPAVGPEPFRPPWMVLSLAGSHDAPPVAAAAISSRSRSLDRSMPKHIRSRTGLRRTRAPSGEATRRPFFHRSRIRSRARPSSVASSRSTRRPVGSGAARLISSRRLGIVASDSTSFRTRTSARSSTRSCLRRRSSTSKARRRANSGSFACSAARKSGSMPPTLRRSTSGRFQVLSHAVHL